MSSPRSSGSPNRLRRTRQQKTQRVPKSTLAPLPGMRQSYEAFLLWVSKEAMAALCEEVAQEMDCGELTGLDEADQRRLMEHAYLRHLENKRARRRTRHNETKDRRRARLHAVTVEKFKRQDIIARDNSTCHICGKPVPASDIHLDHVIPISKGGPHTPENVKVACSTCNLRKGATHPSDTTAKLRPPDRAEGERRTS